jgi:zinc/manganese transport system substrate-binding protein
VRVRTRRLRTTFSALSATTLALAASALAAGCGATSSANTRLSVVADENFWGSIAAQIAGNQADVHSIITNPAQDPHDYEPTAHDARALAMSRLAIVNGVGYDPWAPKLLAANPDGARIVLDVGSLFGLHDGDNPHQWYDPGVVAFVAHTVAADLSRLDRKHAGYYAQRLHTFLTVGLGGYRQLIAQIRSRYAGVPVGASESVFEPLARALGLALYTPGTFLRAISEGSEVSAQDTITAQNQITRHEIRVWLYNPQNITPQVERLNALARANHIPIATATETLTPAKASFEQWQVAQLEQIERALHEATGR